jgi:hypothetical protein
MFCVETALLIAHTVVEFKLFTSAMISQKL